MNLFAAYQNFKESSQEEQRAIRAAYYKMIRDFKKAEQ
jgi:hypothetical protein